MGEVAPQARVRGYGLSLEQPGLSRFAAQSTSPDGRGEPSPEVEHRLDDYFQYRR